MDGVLSAEGELPGQELLVGRPYGLPIDIFGEPHGPMFNADFDGVRKLYACSTELVEEPCDEDRFAKDLTKPLDRGRPLAGDGLFTSYYGESNWHKADTSIAPRHATACMSPPK